MECYPGRELARTCARLGQSATWSRPAFFAFEPTKSLLFILEPKRNRIGVFDANTYVFKSWFSCHGHTYGNVGGRSMFTAQKRIKW